MYIDPMTRYSGRERRKLRVGYVLYQLVGHLLTPILILVLFLRSRKEPLYGENLGHRFGFMAAKNTGSVFVFAASLGETRAAAPVLRRLLDRGETILLTHSSASGLAEGRRAFNTEIEAGTVVQGYVPTDLFWALSMFYTRHKPKLGLVVEAELWPGLLMEARRKNIPMFQINGNYTQRGFERDQRLSGGFRLLFWRLYQMVLTKSKERAERYSAAGFPSDHIKLVGELKFDLAIKEDQTKKAESLLQAAPPHGPVFEIVSSVEDEEDKLIYVLKSLRGSLSPCPHVVWVPRSPQRFEAVADRLRQEGFTVAQRSACLDDDFQIKDGDLWPDVLVGDSIGEMDFYYSLADIVFVGGTLNASGGHNIIEPLALQKPVVTGASIHAILYPAIEAMDAGAMQKFDSEKELALFLVKTLNNVEKMKEFRDKTLGFNSQHIGAADRSIEEIALYLDNPNEP
ncbi:MAG: glycosyltransferase N-terminal domain-containing protein [Pseudoruegeria sp.]